MAKQIPLSKGFFALVDDDDYEKLKGIKWSLISSRGMKYAKGWHNGRHVQMHRQILNLSDPKVQVDHKNHDTLDNRKHNLRIATNAQNCANRKSKIGSKSNFRGVYFRKDTGKWTAEIHKEGQRVKLGSFAMEIDAAIAYNKKAKEIHGEFAFENKIDFLSK